MSKSRHKRLKATQQPLQPNKSSSRFKKLFLATHPIWQRRPYMQCNDRWERLVTNRQKRSTFHYALSF